MKFNIEGGDVRLNLILNVVQWLCGINSSKRQTFGDYRHAGGSILFRLDMYVTH